MNRAQRAVVLVVSISAAATLFLGIPKRGHHEEVPSKAQLEWDRRADSLKALLPWAPTLDELRTSTARELAAQRARTATVVPPDTMLERLRRQEVHDTKVGYLGRRPGPDARFIREPDAHEVLLRYVLPILLVGFGLFVWFGKPKEGA